MQREPRTGRAKNSARRGRYFFNELIRAGFEPFGVRGMSKSFVRSNEVRCILSNTSRGRRGSKPARANGRAKHANGAPSFSPYLSLLTSYVHPSSVLRTFDRG